MAPRKVLISGCGIAGPALAFWLTRLGCNVTLVERAPGPRESGYMIDVWGLGFGMAERMGILPRLRDVGYEIDELRMVDRQGRRIAGVDGEVMRSAFDGRFLSVLRSDLARAIYRTIDGRAETVFGDTILGLEQHADGVDVVFEHAPARRFDLVAGADGLHSAVRELAFGPERRFEHFLGYRTAAFIVDGYPHRDEDVYVSYTVPGRQVARYTLRNNRTGFFLFFADADSGDGARDAGAQKALLERRFSDDGWEIPEVMAALRSTDDLYFDTVSQIRMDRWFTERVVLLGDAASCPSLLAGEGSALAMAGAYLLARELDRAEDDHTAAFEKFQASFKPFVAEKQRAAATYGGWFAPKTHASLAVRNLVTRALSAPVIGPWAMRRIFQVDDPLPRLARE